METTKRTNHLLLIVVAVLSLEIVSVFVLLVHDLLLYFDGRMIMIMVHPLSVLDFID